MTAKASGGIVVITRYSGGDNASRALASTSAVRAASTLLAAIASRALTSWPNTCR